MKASSHIDSAMGSMEDLPSAMQTKVLKVNSSLKRETLKNKVGNKGTPKVKSDNELTSPVSKSGESTLVLEKNVKDGMGYSDILSKRARALRKRVVWISTHRIIFFYTRLMRDSVNQCIFCRNVLKNMKINHMNH
jgi:hypothetical protein